MIARLIFLTLALAGSCTLQAQSVNEISTGVKITAEHEITFKKMAAEFSEKIKADPKNWQLYHQRAKIYMILQMKREAIADYDTALSGGGPHADYFYYRGLNKLMASDPYGACADFSEAAKLGNDLRDVNYAMICGG